MKKIILLAVVLICIIKTQAQSFFMFTKTATTVAKDSIRVQLDTNTSVNVSGWTHLVGDPSKSLKTATAGNANSISISTVNTAVQNWTGFGGASTGLATGNLTATQPSYATGVMSECYFNSNGTYNASFPQFITSGWNPAKTYTVKMSGTLNCSFSLSTNGEYRVFGASLQTMQTMITLCNTVTGGSNPNTVLTWTGVTPDGSGNIKIYFNPVSGQQVAALSWFIIKEE